MSERLVTSGLSPFQRFQIGDRVAHFNIGDGIVEKNNGEYIVVKFDSGARGEYDIGWFNKYPGLLFHRNTQTVKP